MCGKRGQRDNNIRTKTKATKQREERSDSKKVRENNTKYSSYLHERQDLGTRRERQAG